MWSRPRAAARSTAASARSSKCAAAISTAFAIARVIDDIADAHARGARTIFLVDDNITLDVPRFEELCRAIVAAGLHHIDYIAQAMTASIAAHGDRLAALMQRAGFRYVFLGIENILDEDLKFLNARAKNSRHRAGRRTNTAVEAVDALHRHGMLVVGGLIVGNPDDRRDGDCGQPGVRAPLCRLAVHSASDAVPRDADDAWTSSGAISSSAVASTSTTARRR